MRRIPSILDHDFLKGGPGSGNFGHSGRPGEVGGSAPEGGGGESLTGEGKSGGAVAITSEPTIRTDNEYNPSPDLDINNDGITDFSRVGVPASETPPPPPIPRLPNLTADERDVENRFTKAFEDNPEAMVDEYLAKLQAGEVGDAMNVFSTDDAKLLSPDYNPHGSAKEDINDAKSRYNVVVHQTANAIAKRAFLKYMDEVVSKLPEDKRTVLVTAGGVASGKGYAISSISEVNDISKAVGAIWDAAGEQNGTENPWILKEAKARGIKPIFAFIDADPSETWENPKRGVMERAQTKGRMVDAQVFADSYEYGAKNFKAFADKHRGDKSVGFIFIENRGTPKQVSAFPDKALKSNSKDIYASASKAIDAKTDLRPAVRRGGTIGRRIWPSQ